MGAQLVPETSRKLHILKRLSAWENFIEFCFLARYNIDINFVAEFLQYLENGLIAYENWVNVIFVTLMTFRGYDYVTVSWKLSIPSIYNFLWCIQYVKCGLVINPRVLGFCYYFDYKREAEWSVLPTQYCSGDKIEKNEMGGACSIYGCA